MMINNLNKAIIIADKKPVEVEMSFNNKLLTLIIHPILIKQKRRGAHCNRRDFSSFEGIFCSSPYVYVMSLKLETRPGISKKQMDEITNSFNFEAYDDKESSMLIKTDKNFLNIEPKQIALQRFEHSEDRSRGELTYKHVQFNYTNFKLHRKKPFYLGLRTSDNTIIKYPQEIFIMARRQTKDAMKEPSFFEKAEQTQNRKRKRTSDAAPLNKRRPPELKEQKTKEALVQTGTFENSIHASLQEFRSLIDQHAVFFQATENFNNNTLLLYQKLVERLIDLEKQNENLQNQMNLIKQEVANHQGSSVFVQNKAIKPTSEELSTSFTPIDVINPGQTDELFSHEINTSSFTSPRTWCNFFQEPEQPCSSDDKNLSDFIFNTL